MTTFAGVKRRQELKGEAGGITLLDDFAHHPTAIRATLEAIAERFAPRRIVAAFEPRSNTARRAVFTEFPAARSGVMRGGLMTEESNSSAAPQNCVWARQMQR